MPAISRFYAEILAPGVPWVLALLGVFGMLCLWLAWRSRRLAQPGPLTVLVVAGLLLLVARSQLPPASAGAVGLVLLAHAVALYGLARYDWPVSAGPKPPAPVWAGIAIVAAAFALKCVALDSWPRILNAYAAWTGLDAIRALNGHWPAEFFQGKEYDLMNGGHSPLMLPLLWCSMQIFGGTTFAVRFAEVVASTMLLIVFWLWLRRRVPGGWGPIALSVFAFSPWHLAQSRMGTFHSISVALAVMLLWIGTRVSHAPAGMGWWFAFGSGAGLIGYAYAPVKVLYLFFLIVVVANCFLAWRRGLRRWWHGPSLALVTCALVLALQLWNPERFGEMFRSDFGVLATDTSIWHKTPDGEVTTATQPVRLIAENFFRNAAYWMQNIYAQPAILVWYAPALSLGILIACVALGRGGDWVASVYFLIGLLPPLIIFPVARRGLIVWPLVYVVGVIYARELARRAGMLLPRVAWRVGCHAVVLAMLAVASLHGLHLFASTNSIINGGTYFGGDHVWRMLRAAEPLLATHRLYFVNLDDQLMPIVEMEWFEPDRAVGRRHAWEYVTVHDDDTHLDALPQGEPLAFLHLVHNEDDDDRILEKVATLLPGGTLQRYRDDDGSDILLYSFYRLDGGT